MKGFPNENKEDFMYKRLERMKQLSFDKKEERW